MFDAAEDPFLTATGIADQLPISRQGVHHRLEAMRAKSLVDKKNENGGYYGSTFTFLSAQGGLLTVLCLNDGISPSAGHYTYSDREEAIDELFPELFGIEASEVASQWSEFLDHRHAIMHGDQEAYFDETIASVALIFLVLSLYTAIVELGE